MAKTLEQAEQDYEDSLGYARLNDLTLAHEHDEAIGLLILKIQTEASFGSSRVRNDEKVRMLVGERDKVNKWISARDATRAIGIRTTLIEPAVIGGAA